MQANQPLLTALLPQLVTALVPVLGAALMWLMHAAVARMHAGAGKDVALELVTAADTVVRDIEARVKPRMVDAAKTGNISALEAADLKMAATSALKDQLSNAALSVIRANSERLDDVLGRAIEAALSRYKDAGIPPVAVVDHL